MRRIHLLRELELTPCPGSLVQNDEDLFVIRGFQLVWNIPQAIDF